MTQIKIPDQIMISIKQIVKKTGLFKDETDFVSQAILKEIRKYKNL